MSTKMHEPYVAFKRFLAGNGLTYKDVAEVIGKVENTVQLKINGQSDFYISEQRKICEKWGIDRDIFFTNIVANTITKSIIKDTA